MLHQAFEEHLFIHLLIIFVMLCILCLYRHNPPPTIETTEL